jgi:hypothetical protein
MPREMPAKHRAAFSRPIQEHMGAAGPERRSRELMPGGVDTLPKIKRNHLAGAPRIVSCLGVAKVDGGWLVGS